GNNAVYSVDLTANTVAVTTPTSVNVTVSATEFDNSTSNNTFAVSTTVNPANCTPPPSGMVSWYSGDIDGSDIWGANPGTETGGVTHVAGKVGQAFSFSGTNQYVSTADSSDFDFGTGDFSIDS